MGENVIAVVVTSKDGMATQTYTVLAGLRAGMAEIRAGDQRAVVHPQVQRHGQRFTLPDQWDGLENGKGRPRREAVVVQVRPESWSGAPGRLRAGGGRYQVTALDQARQHLESLGLKQAVEVLNNTPYAAGSKQFPQRSGPLSRGVSTGS